MTCLICGGPRKDIVIRSEEKPDNLDWAWCGACKLFFRKDIPDEATIARFYESDAYRENIHADRFRKWGLTGDGTVVYEAINSAQRAQHVVMCIDNLGWTPKRFLDVGTGMGLLPWSVTRYWKECEAKAVEPNLGYVLVKDIEILPSLQEVTGTFDTITCIHTLEHNPRPIQFLSDMAKHLEPNGRLFIETPNFSPKDKNNPFERSHLFAYTVDGLMRTASLAGLKPVTYLTHGWLWRARAEASIFMVLEHGNETRSF